MPEIFPYGMAEGVVDCLSTQPEPTFDRQKYFLSVCIKISVFSVTFIFYAILSNDRVCALSIERWNDCVSQLKSSQIRRHRCRGDERLITIP